MRKKYWKSGHQYSFIATRHDSHADYVKKAWPPENMCLFEKPLCLNEQT